MKSNTISFSPVIIPTLNRYKHFRRCLESLEACVGANNTDVYVAVDYPPSERYIMGWEEICNYLSEKQKTHKFKSLVVLRRDHNCGVGTPNSNGSILVREVSVLYESYIFSEDDNVFSPNFLLYINQGLEKYRDDEKCLAICGYNYYGVNVPVRENVYLSREYSAWGVGYWTKKKEELLNIYNEDFLKSILGSWSNIWIIFKNEPRLLNTILLNLDSHKVFGDTIRVCYQYLNDKYSLFPVISKVRNEGFDNTGTTIFKTDDNYNKQEIDANADFAMDRIEDTVLPEVQKAISTFFKRSLFMNCIILVRVAIYKMIGIDILYFEAKRRNRTLFR